MQDSDSLCHCYLSDQNKKLEITVYFWNAHFIYKSILENATISGLG